MSASLASHPRTATAIASGSAAFFVSFLKLLCICSNKLPFFQPNAGSVTVVNLRNRPLRDHILPVYGFKAAPKDSVMPKQVMIVEDNELNMKLFRDLIEASGYTTIQTRNGMEALELARKYRPDLILMDIQLPEVSGLEVTKWLKEDDDLHVIPVIAVTAFAMKGDEERIRQGGCEAYVSKPISVPKFIETIKTYLGDA
jgi:two-component system cell cycle response regulator DivK